MQQPFRLLARDLLAGRLSRRLFIRRLAALGVTFAAARELAADLAAGPPAVARGEAFKGTGGALTARALRAAGVEHVFGIPGTAEVGFIDALVDAPELRYVLGLHEGPVAAMADGYAKVSRKTAFVNVHTIAGTANVLGQLVNASRDGTPIVFTAGNQDSRLRGRDAFLEGLHLELLPQHYAKWVWDVQRAELIPEMLRRAFKLAATPPGGPVFLTIAKDLWQQRDVSAEILPQARFGPPAPLVPDDREIDRAASWLVDAERPLLLAGDEIVRDGGRDALVEIAEALALPVVGELVSGHGRVDFPTRHPLYLGPFPGQRDLPLPFDLLVNAGGRMFSDFDYDPRPIVDREVPAIHLSIDPLKLGQTYPVDLPLLGHCGEALERLRDRVLKRLTASRRHENVERRRAIAAVRVRLEASRRELLQGAWDQEPLAPARLAAELDATLDADAIVVTELITSDTFHTGYIHYHNGQPGRLHLASHGGNLGWGIGAACGAKLASPDREVVLLSGDGSFHFGIQGLWTAARYEIPVLFVVWNNRSYQSNRLALVKYGGRSAATRRYLGSHLGNPEIDHVAIAGGYGVEGEKVGRPDRLRSALVRGLEAVRSGRPYVLDVAIARRRPETDSEWSGAFSVASGS